MASAEPEEPKKSTCIIDANLRMAATILSARVGLPVERLEAIFFAVLYSLFLERRIVLGHGQTLRIRADIIEFDDGDETI